MLTVIGFKPEKEKEFKDFLDSVYGVDGYSYSACKAECLDAFQADIGGSLIWEISQFANPTRRTHTFSADLEELVIRED